MPSSTTPFSMRLEQDLRDALTTLARIDERSLSSMISKILHEYVARQRRVKQISKR